eukprot:7391826-Prymnesium_polylepis.1
MNSDKEFAPVHKQKQRQTCRQQTAHSSSGRYLAAADCDWRLLSALLLREHPPSLGETFFDISPPLCLDPPPLRVAKRRRFFVLTPPAAPTVEN